MVKPNIYTKNKNNYIVTQLFNKKKRKWQQQQQQSR